MKKLATILALTAVVANMGVAAVFAQNPAPATRVGTQDIDCVALSNAFGTGVSAPNNFQIGSDGSRPILSSNDTVGAYNDLLQSAYFEETTPGVFTNTTDTLTVSSNTAFSCGNTGRSLQLTVGATRFNNGSINLMTYGSDGAIGGTGTAEDYNYIFSVNTSAPPACTGGPGTCVLALGSTEPIGALNGTSNGFTNVGPHNKASTTDDANALLHPADQAVEPNPAVILYYATHGFEGTVTIPGLDFNLSLPSNVASMGLYSSTVTYTLTNPGA